MEKFLRGFGEVFEEFLRDLFGITATKMSKLWSINLLYINSSQIN